MKKNIFWNFTLSVGIFSVVIKYKNIDKPIYKRKKLIYSRIDSIDEEKETKKIKENEKR